MAKRHSKNIKTEVYAPKAQARSRTSAKTKAEPISFKTAFHVSKNRAKSRIHHQKLQAPHRSFRRSYREDYEREFEAPGLLSHAAFTLKTLFKNWRLFLPLMLLVVVLNILLVGLMNEATFVTFQNTLDQTTEGLKTGELGTFAKSGLLLISTVTTGGLSTGMSESQQIFSVLLFIIVWLVTIYLLRQTIAGHKVRLRDGLYNALSPLLSTIIVAAVIFIEAIPIMIVIVSYSAAISTDFLSTPFYAFIYVIFAVLMILLSLYLISSSLIALVAVSAPGLYPFVAIRSASKLLAGRRIKFIIRIVFLLIIAAIFWVIIMTPLIALDLWLKSSIDWLAGIPFVSIELLLMTCFTTIYATAYFYLFYRRLLDYEN